MSSRGIRAFYTDFSPPLYRKIVIPDQATVLFSSDMEHYYTKITSGTIFPDINKIEYNYSTGIFKINTASVTYNDFIIYWAICLKTVNSNKMPCFSLVVRNEDNSIFTTLPSNDVMKSTVLYGNSLLHLPTPAPDIPKVSYYLSVVNTTGADCFYSTKAIYLADIIIICIDLD